MMLPNDICQHYIATLKGNRVEVFLTLCIMKDKHISKNELKIGGQHANFYIRMHSIIYYSTENIFQKARK